jgi:hypothetical protein
VRLVIRAKEARPSSARIELRARAEQRQAAEATRVRPLFLVVEKDSAESRFRTVLEQHAALAAVQSGGDLVLQTTPTPARESLTVTDLTQTPATPRLGRDFISVVALTNDL